MKTKMCILFMVISCIAIISCQKDGDEFQEYIRVNIKGTSDDGIALNESFVLNQFPWFYDSTMSNFIDMHCDTTVYDIMRGSNDSLNNYLQIVICKNRFDLSPVVRYNIAYSKIIDHKKVLVINEINLGASESFPNHVLNFSYNENTQIVKGDYEFEEGGLNGNYQMYGDFVIKVREINK